MKLKELPVSLFWEFKLGNIPVEKLTKKKEVLPVLVSLTTIQPRIKKVHLVIRSILSQPQIPKKIILNLNENLKTHVPESLKSLEGERYGIHFSPLDCPHMKLIPTLNRFPKEVIITCDDDLFYRKNWLRLLYEQHLKNPDKIITNQSRIISFSPEGRLLSYKEWPTHYKAKMRTKRLLPIGSSGTLYPINSLHKTVFEKNLFNELSPKADDLWFKAMSLLKGVESIQSTNTPKEPLPIFGSQKVSLKKYNVGADKNRQQWLALTKHFNLNLDDN